MRIHPFDALRPAEKHVGEVACVPYDTVNTAEARALVGRNPRSFLRVTRAEIEFPDGTDAYSDAIYNRSLANFERLQKEGSLVREGKPCLYIYRQKMGKHVQRSVMACCHIEDYERNLIKKHEHTREDKRKDRLRVAQTLRTNTGPVFLVYRSEPAVDVLVRRAEKGKPLYDFVAEDGIGHTVWRVEDSTELQAAFVNIPVCYIADGHHRAAAAVDTGIEARRRNPNHTGQEEYNWFMAALFPADQIQILSYNRCVADLNGMTTDVFLARVREQFDVRKNAGAKPRAPRRISMYLDGAWYGLSWKETPGTDVVAGLDVSVLQDRLLNPLLNIRDPRKDSRIDFIGGIRGTGELEKRVNSGLARVAFSLYPTSIETVMSVADAGLIMPPKSTWFEPKLRSGLILHTF